VPSKLGKTNFFSSVYELGPYNIGGRTRTMIIDRSNSSRLIAGGVSGGIWISEDAGGSWAPINDAASTLTITSITQSPFNPKIMYYSTGEVSSGVHINYNGDGIFKSIDGGLTFKQLEASSTTSFQKTWDIEHSKTDANTIYVATISDGLYRSKDGGESFDQIHNTSVDINDVDATEDGRVYFTKEGAGLYYFDENEVGSTTIVEVIDNGFPTTGFARCLVEASVSNPNVVYMVCAGSDRASLFGVYKSTDKAKTWKAMTNPEKANGLSFNQTWHNLTLAVNPADPNHVIVAGVEAAFSINGASSWSEQVNTHSDYHDVVFVPGSDTYYSVSDGGIYRYSKITAGVTATNRNTKLNITQIYAGDFFPTGDNVIIGAQDNWTTTNTNGGSSFDIEVGGDGSFNAIDATGNIRYASSQNGNLRRWNGGGWSRIYNNLASKLNAEDFWFINPFAINPTDGTQLYFPSKRALARTTNSGSSFTKITNDFSGFAFCVGMTSEDNPTLYVGGQSSMLYRIKNAKTAQAGDEFRMLSLSPPQAKGAFIGNIEVDPNEQTTIYLAHSNASTLPRIWKVLNADTDVPTWVDISSNLPTQLPVNWIEVDPKDSKHIMVATDYGLYFTLNGGQWWEKEESIPNVYVPMIRLRESDRKLFVFTYGRGVWVAQLEETIFSSLDPNDERKSLVVLHPNPTSDYLELKNFAWINYVIYGYNGQVVLQGDYSQSSTGNIKVTGLASGNYIISAEAENGTTVTKHFMVN
jgi:hypothetical protein